MVLTKIQKRLRRMIIENSFRSNACHIGSALSAIEIIVEIFSKMGKNDLFVFSKASGVAALYVILAEKGYFPKNKVAYYLKKYPLASKEVPGVLHSVGSLGHGLPVATGLALADRKRDVYVLVSDGELQCGTTWECLLFIKHHKIKNLKIYCDWNGLQACGKIKDILDLPYDFLRKRGIKMIKTIKGKGVNFMENRYEWHYWNLSEFQFKQAMKELD